MGAEYLSYVKSIATFALTFFGYIISVLASVLCLVQPKPGFGIGIRTEKKIPTSCVLKSLKLDTDLQK